MKSELIIKLLCTLIALMFFYAAVSKLMDYDRSRSEMMAQIFPRSIADILVWLVPSVELIITVLLLYNPTRLKGLFASIMLLACFSVYIVVSMSGVSGKIPCGCGGILRHMGYWTHLVFNIVFIVLAMIGVMLEKNWIINRIRIIRIERRSVKTS